MLSYRRYSAPPGFAIPAAGSKVIFHGDSISDTNYRHWANKLMDRYGWIGVNQTYIGGTGAGAGAGNFETNQTGLNAESNCFIGTSATHATLSPVASAHSAVVGATAAGTYFANFGTGLSNFMEQGNTYTFSAWVQGVTGAGTPASILLQFQSTGSPVPTVNSAGLSALNTWTHLSVTNTVGPSASDAILRLINTGAPAGAVTLIDGAELRRVTAGQASNTSALYEDWGTRAAISGTNLQANDGTASNGVATFAARITNYMPVDLLFVCYGMNDLYYINGSPTPTTPATWTTAVASILTSYGLLVPKPQLIWLGINNSRDALALPAWAVSQDDAARQLDTITASLVAAAGGVFVPMRPAMDFAFVDPAQLRHPVKPTGENFMFERIVRFLEMGM